MEEKGKIGQGIVERLGEIKDQRREWGNKRHELVDILFIALCTIVCGLTDFEDMVIFGRERIEWLRKYVRLEHGIPSASTFERVFQAMRPEAMGVFYRSWASSMREEKRSQISLDGKTICGAGAAQKVHIVSAWAQEEGLCLGQIRVDEKSNEITAIPELLAILDIRECVVTLDAMGCQKEIAKEIITRGGEYVLAVKGNHPTLANEVKECFEWVDRENPTDIKVEKWLGGYEKEHGRIEHREVRVMPCPEWPGVQAEWTSLKTLVHYRCSRESTGDQSGAKVWSDRYYISSLDCSAQEMSQYLRNHWAIENQLHWLLDVRFREDASTIRMYNAPENLNTLRKVAATLLRNTPTVKKTSVKGKMTRAALNAGFLETVLFALGSP